MTPARPSDRPVALVTGGSSGIGQACALALGATHDVWLTYRSGESAAQTVVQTIRSHGGRAWAVSMNANCPPSIDSAHARFVDAYEREHVRPRLDLLVANAGTFGRGYRFLLEIEEHEWDEVWATNASGVVRLLRTFLDLLLPGGMVVNVSTISAPLGAIGYKSQAHYATSKAAIEGFVEALGAAHQFSGLHCINLVPGMIETRMLRDHFGLEWDAYEAAVPLKRYGRPEEIGRMVAAIASPAPGKSIRRISADGGWLQRGWSRIQTFG